MPLEFVFNVKKARQTIVAFIVLSLLLLALILFTDNKISRQITENAPFILLCLSAYFLYIAILIRRFYQSFSRNGIKIAISNEEVRIPNYYLGIKRIPTSKIYSLEKIGFGKNKDILVLGVIDGKKVMFDKSIFSEIGDFKKFTEELKCRVISNSNEDIRQKVNFLGKLQEEKIYWSTIFITVFCVFFYFISTSGGFIEPRNYDFLVRVAADKNILSTGEYYRIFTSPFAHANIFHLLLNLLFLGVLGELFERIIGIPRFVNIFLISCAAGYFSFFFFTDADSGLGSSGGIYGIWGAYLYLKIKYEKFLPGSTNAIPLKQLIVLIVLELVLEIFFLDNVAFQVHITGFITGFAYISILKIGKNLELINKPTRFEKVLFTGLALIYSIGISSFFVEQFSYLA